MIITRLPIPLPDPHLEDDELVLRPWALCDAPALSAAWADPEVIRWTGVPRQTSVEAARRWITGDADRRARGLALDLVIDVRGEVAGEVGLAEIDPAAGTAEIGWWIGAPWRGRRLASRAAQLVAAWALDELHVEAILAHCHGENPASVAVARAAGFMPERSTDGVEVWRCC